MNLQNKLECLPLAGLSSLVYCLQLIFDAVMIKMFDRDKQSSLFCPFFVMHEWKNKLKCLPLAGLSSLA
jgi:hypothetical protein